MVRELMRADEETVMKIWLAGNRQAHAFIEKEYWESRYDAVRGMLPRAEVYVYEEEGVIAGFIGLAGTYIEGLFVKEAARRRGRAKSCWIL